MIVIYDHKMLIVQATVITIVNYAPKTFIVLLTGFYITKLFTPVINYLL
jgi:hypothetical protein